MFIQVTSSFSVNCLFYVLNTLEFIGFLVLSLHWPELMRYWQNIESLPIFQNGTYKTGYVRRIRIVAFTTLLLAFGIYLQQIFLTHLVFLIVRMHRIMHLL